MSCLATNRIEITMINQMTWVLETLGVVDLDMRASLERDMMYSLGLWTK
jgi:hypothetical protein